MDVQSAMIAVLCVLVMLCMASGRAEPDPLPEPLTAMSAEPSSTLLLYNVDKYPEVGDPLRPAFTPKVTVFIKDNVHNDPKEMIVTFGLPHADNSNCSIVGAYLDTNTKLKSWKKKTFFIHSSRDQIKCQCKRSIQPGVTASPDRRKLIFYGFGAAACAKFIVLYDGTTATTSVLSVVGVNVPWAFSPGLVTVRTRTSSTIFTLLSYGGSHCDNASNSECLRFSTGIFRLTIDTLKTSAPVRWEGSSPKSKHSPCPSHRSNPTLINLNDSHLLLYGGVESVSNFTELRLLNDFWIYNIHKDVWLEVSSDSLPNDTSLSRPDMMSSYYTEREAAYLSEYRTLIVVVSVAYGPLQLYLCTLPIGAERHIHCELKGDVQGVKAFFPTIMFYFSLCSGAVDKFFIVFYNTETTKTFTVGKEIHPARNTSQLMITPVYTKNIRIQFPGFQGCITSAPVARSGRQGSTNRFLFVGGTCYDTASREDERFSRPSSKYSGVVWNLGLGVVYSRISASQVSPSPDLTRHSSHTLTSLGESIAVLYGGFYGVTGTFTYTNMTWCMLTHYDPLAQDFSVSWQRFVTPTSQSMPLPRGGHVAFPYKPDGMIIQGGSVGSERIFGDLWILKITSQRSCTGEWIELTKNVVGERLPQCSQHSATLYNDDVIMFGGYCIDNDNSTGSGAGETSLQMTDHLLVITIKNLSFISLKRITLSRPIYMRTSHSLSRYTNDSFLLLGGLAYSNDGEHTAIEALLLQFIADTTVKVIPYFNFTIFNHHVIREYIFSGFRNWAPAESLNFLRLQKGHYCPVAYERTEYDSCQPCPQGYHSATIPQQCKKCPGDSRTSGPGAAECTTICTDSFCHGHGECLVDQGNKMNCK